FGARHADPAALAAALSIEAEEITGTGLPVQSVSTGLAHVIVPVRSLAAMHRLHPSAEELGAALALFPGAAAYCFTREVEQPGSYAHCRMFAPHLGTAEDPATGSAAGPLACYLTRHTDGGRVRRFRFEQGIEMGRPSLLEASVEQNAGAITAVRVAGEARILGEGWLTLEASLPREVGGVPGGAGGGGPREVGGVPGEAGRGGDR